MSDAKSDTWETKLLKLFFTNVDAALIGDATGLRGSSTAGSLWISLWVGNPLDTGAGGAEATYTGYARVAVARSAAQWTVTAQQVVNDNVITFGLCTAGTDNADYGGVHTAVSGGELCYYAALAAMLPIAAGITPSVAAGALTIDET